MTQSETNSTNILSIIS